MSDPLSPNLSEKIKQRLSFYEDLGLAPFYRYRTASVLLRAPVSPLTVPHQSFVGASRVGGTAPQLPQASAANNPPFTPAQIANEEAILPKPTPKPELRASIPASSAPLIPLVKTASFFEQLERVPDDTLLRIRADIGDCTRCRLHKKRTHIVFADGNPKADLVFVGEGPGADEDATGIPFVGRAGKLLTQMIQAMGLQREDVYICNVVKCRPPENRQPEPDEVTTCSPYLVRQLEVVNPKVIVCLGATAAQTLLETTTGISKFRGQWLDFRGKKLLATYHPAYLLRNPAAKSEVWKDLQKVMAELGLQVKKGKPA